jgi:hypothetical protein
MLIYFREGDYIRFLTFGELKKTFHVRILLNFELAESPLSGRMQMFSFLTYKKLLAFNMFLNK